MSKDIHILELSAYEQPIIKESKREDWVEFGVDNNYYGFLIDCYTNSTTQNAIVNNISRLIYGKGLSATDGNRKPNDYATMMALFSKDCVRYLVTDLKLLGQCAMQVIYTKDRKKIVQVEHIPVQLLRAEKCNSENGKIEAYYYSDDWTDVKKYKPKRIAAFGCSKDPIEIYFVKPYSVGLKYYALPDYIGCLPYCTLEESISEYLINEVNNGFSSRSVINFNNGQPSDEQQQMIKNKVLSQLTGTTGEKVIVSFNNNVESKTTVDAMPVNDAPDLYSTLAEECLRKIMLGNNVTSPLLFGIASSNGFSSNSDELKDSFILFDNMVIRPMQELLLDAFDNILAYNGISLNLYFKTLKPLEFTDLSGLEDAEQIEEETGLELSGDYVGKELIELGEMPNSDWLLIDEFEVDYDLDEEENTLLSSEIKTDLSLKDKLIKLVSSGMAFPNAKSSQDEVIDGINFITRYVYAGEKKSNSRKFCVNMMAAKKIYRKEDIVRMESNSVNKGWGPKGTDFYSVWLWKGGGNCYHRWNKQIYVSFAGTGIDVRSPLAKRIAGVKAAKYGYVIKNDSKVSQRPIDMPNKAFIN
jgi:hypothetical protein